MPQDGHRSGVYRSFFSCEDPKGVVECKTNRKSKIDSHKLENQKKQKNLSKSFSLNGERNDTVSKGPIDHDDDDLHNPSSYHQLMEISRGAQKLNQVIDNWSKEISIDRQSKNIAKDLLRGALDLKESLAMLGKLQEASQIMAKLKKKHKEKVEKGGGGKLDGVGIERTTSDRFGYANHRIVEFENPRLSVDGSTRDCFDELRDVIKESFARQNLLPKSYNEEKAYFDRTKSDFLMDPSSQNLLPKSCKQEKVYSDRPKSDFLQDLPSTSSSQSSHFFSYEFDSSDSSLSKSIEEKPKTPNVIAKLMGLEEISPKRLQSYPLKHHGKDKGLNQGRTAFDIDLPRSRRPHFTGQKVDPQPRTLEELTETIQFKGLMTSKSVHEPQHLSDISDWKKRFANDSPPIVIIKPLHVSDLLDEELHRKKHEGLVDQKIFRKQKMKQGLPPRPNNDRERTAKLSEIHRKTRAEKSPGKRPIKEKGEKDCGDAFSRKDDKSIKRQENLSSATMKASAPVKSKIQKKEVTAKTAPRIQKAVPNTRKAVEVETAKCKDAFKSLQPNKLNSANLTKPEGEPSFSRVRVSQEKVATADSMSECIAVTQSHGSNFQKKNIKNEKTVIGSSTNLAGKKFKNDNIPVEPASDNVQNVTAKLIMPSQQLPGDKEKVTSGNIDNCKKSTSNVSASTKSVLPKSEIKTNEGANYVIINDNITEKKSCKRSDATRNLLLDSTSFVNLAEELFNIQVCQPVHSHTTGFHDYGTADIKALLECAKELLENKSLQRTVAVHPMPNVFGKESKIRISLDRLVNEICDGIEYLRSYYKLADKWLVVHKLETVLEKDMWSKGVVNGAWDLGWRKGFTQDEIDQVVVDIEQKILSGLIEDVLMDVAF